MIDMVADRDVWQPNLELLPRKPQPLRNGTGPNERNSSIVEGKVYGTLLLKI